MSPLLLVTPPVFAQDAPPATPFAGGGGGAQVFTRVDAVNPMEQVKAFLAKANITLSADQEKTLRPSVEAAIKQLQDISDRFAAERGRGEGRGGGRGGAGLAGLGNKSATPELEENNCHLASKITRVLKT